MQDQPTAGRREIPDAEEAAFLVLTVLLTRYPALVAMEELVRDLAGTPTREGLPAVFVEDTVNELVRDGLAHRLERFVFASHSAVRADALHL